MDRNLIDVVGVLNLSKLDTDFNEDEFISLYQIPIDLNEPNNAKIKYYRSSIKTNVQDTYSGIVYFQSPPANLIDLFEQGAHQIPLHIAGSISFLTENAFQFGFVIVVTSHCIPDATASYTAGNLFVIADGLYRRIQDRENIYPPIFEVHLQNTCIYSDRKDTTTSYIFNGPVHPILDSIEQADTELISCKLCGTFTGYLSHRTMAINPLNAIVLYRDSIDEFDLSDGPGSLDQERVLKAFTVLSSLK